MRKLFKRWLKDSKVSGLESISESDNLIKDINWVKDVSAELANAWEVKDFDKFWDVLREACEHYSKDLDESRREDLFVYLIGRTVV